MKYLIVGVVLAVVSIQTISALQCIQGVDMKEEGSSNETEKNDNPLRVTECGWRAALESTVMLSEVKPNLISFPSGDYKCYHLKFKEKNRKFPVFIKGCINKSLNVCDGMSAKDNVREVSCRQCDTDGCNSAGRYTLELKQSHSHACRTDLKLLGMTLAAVVAYLLK